MMVLSKILKKMLIGRAFTNERGRILLFGKMSWTLAPSRAFAVHVQHLGKLVGEKELYNWGFEWCKDAGKEIVESMGMKLGSGWIAQNAVVGLLDFIGWGKVDWLKAEADSKTGHHHLVVKVYDNPALEWGMKLYGKKSMVCTFFRGCYAAHAECELGIKNSYVKENKCICHGSTYCEWESKW
jgi:predicted hydrocarbon binding protein